MTAPGPTLAYFHGDDSYGLDRAVDALFERLAATEPGLERVRVRGDATTTASLGMQVATAPLFGGGTVVVVVEPGPLMKAEDRVALLGLLACQPSAPSPACCAGPQPITGQESSARSLTLVQR